jgi:hypothetical protein
MPIVSLKTGDHLLDIFEKFEEQTDPLSINIRHWGANLFETAANTANSEKIMQIVQECLGILVYEILVDPINQAPLKDPILERSWVWERQMHSEYRKHFSVSPLDEIAMLENPPPHFFAKEMLAWVKGIESIVPQRQTSATISQEQMTLLAKAHAARSKELARQIQEKMEWGLVEVKRETASIQEASTLAMEKAVQNAMQAQQELERQVEIIQKIHAETLAGLQKQMSWREDVHKTKIAALEKRFSSLDQVNSATMASLNNQVQALNQDHKKLVSVFEDKIANLNQAHAINLANFENQLSSIKKDHHSALSSLHSLQNKYTETDQNLRFVSESLKVTQLNSQTQQQEICRLNNSYQQAQIEISHLRNKIDNMDDALCTIL